MSDWPRWACSYRYDGRGWCLTIPAPDAEEAQRRLRAIGMTGQVDGELIATIPANAVTHFPLSILLPVIVAVRNFFARLFRGGR